MRLLLLRHGQTPSNVRGQLDTAAPGAGLTALGRRQAAAVPKGLSSETIAAISISNLLRTLETVGPISRRVGVAPVADARLREISAGSLEMRSDKDSIARYLKAALAWARGDLDVALPGAEDGHAFFARFDAGIGELVDRADGTALAVSHGAAIRTWVTARCTNVEAGHARTHQLDNTGLAILESTGGGAWRLDRWVAGPVGSARLADDLAIDPTGEGQAPA